MGPFAKTCDIVLHTKSGFDLLLFISGNHRFWCCGSSAGSSARKSTPFQRTDRSLVKKGFVASSAYWSLEVNGFWRWICIADRFLQSVNGFTMLFGLVS